MIKTQYIRLDMTPGGTPPVLFCSQYDVGRPLGMVVYNRGEAVDLSTYTCTIEATRTDGTAITAAVTTDGNIGAFSTTATMTNIADRYPAKMVIVDGSGNRVASLAFVMCVTPATMDENAESIEEDASLYQQYTGTVQALIATERQQRQSADNTLRSNIAAEASAREAGDNTLSAEINAEKSARQSADSTLQSNINAEASARQSADASLQAQISQIVAPSGEAPSAAEVQNARIGADGITYSTLGDAIRAQDSQLSSELKDLFVNVKTIFPSDFKIGTYTTDQSGNVQYVAYPNSICSNSSYTTTAVTLITAETNFQFNVFSRQSGGAWTHGSWVTTSKVPANTEFYLIIRKSDVSAGKIEYKNKVHVSLPIVQKITNAMKTEPVLIDAGNYSSILPDANEANDNAIFILNFSRNSNAIPAHLPFASYPYGLTSMLVCTDVRSSSSENVGAWQMFYGPYGDVWQRWRGVNGWLDWENMVGATLTVGVTHGRITDAVNVSLVIPNSTIYINAGYYDLLQELVAVYPSFLTAYYPGQKHGRGLEIGNNTKIISSPDAQILCNYTGDDETFIENFSPFMTLETDMEMDGVKINCSNVRYAIHDDPLVKTTRYKHVYKNCRITVNNSASPKQFRACIGGGLGKQATIEVTNCYFSSVGLADNQGIIGWHNTIVDDAESYISISGNYCNEGTYRAGYYGPSTRNTINLVNNNSFKSAPFVARESADYNNFNMALVAWNNDIRT